MKLTLHRSQPVLTTAQNLPARVYNLAHSLLRRSTQGCVFVPVRSMQYLAIVDSEEIAFVDANYPSAIAISWQKFRPQDRMGLDQPVPFDCVLYHPEESAVQQRLSAEFGRALHVLADRQSPSEPGRVITFERERRRPAED